MTAVSFVSRTETAEPRSVRHIYPFERWNPTILEFLRQADYPTEDKLTEEPSYTQFEVKTIRLPVASDRWAVRWPGHPEVTFEDLRAARLPKPTLEELGNRQQAIRQAHEIRDTLDIRPLTTATITRQLREGTEEE